MDLDGRRAAVRWPGFRHIVFDCDSTLAGIEGIDELANTPGLRAEIEDLTARAMHGQADLHDVYEQRLALIRPDDQQVAALRALYKRSAVVDAARVVEFLQAAGRQVYVVSGGLATPVREFAAFLGVPDDHVAAVAVDHDPLSGAWWSATSNDARQYQGFEGGELTVSDGKARAIQELTGGGRGGLMMVGDGESDARTAPVVDLFVAFMGFVDRPAVADAADVIISEPALAPIAALAAGPLGNEIGGFDDLLDAAASLYESGAFRFDDANMGHRFATAMNYHRRAS